MPNEQGIPKNVMSGMWRPGGLRYGYELLSSTEFENAAKTADAVADAVMVHGWSLPGYPPVALDKPIPWAYALPRHRSWNFHIHSLDMVDPLLLAHDETYDCKYLIPALRVALDWVTKHSRRQSNVSDMAWYDMSVGLRAYRLAYLYQASAAAGILEPTSRKMLWASLEDHRAELSDDTTIKFHNNHGLYQVAGQLALGRRFADVSPAMRALFEQGGERFARLIEMQFTSEGVHREHSPDYHRMVLNTLQAILQAGLIADEELRRLALLIEESLAWFIYPSGILVNFGDSDSRVIERTKATALRKREPSMMSAVGSATSAAGERPSGLKLFPFSGYAVFRCSDPTAPSDPARDSYLAQTGAFHSRTHKHADDLSFVWYDRGQPILVDAGRYGYIGKAEQGSDLWHDGHWYSDPMRVFVESTRAHNTLEFDGQNCRRKGVKPYGSAIEGAAEVEGTFAFKTRCEQHGSISHRRVLVFRPREWLVVFDAFTDSRESSHDVLQWFHLAPGHSAVRSGDGFDVVLNEGEVALRVAGLLPGTRPTSVIVGQEAPVLQGWWSGKEREAVPAPAFGFAREGSPEGVFATVFSFTETLRGDFEGSHADVTGRCSHLRWHDDFGAHQLSIDCEADLSIAYSATRA